ncbi:Rubrerythrin [Candidatus Koribacter versatilis Ellin345]|uniref:Rubrerythrin n=2 Tax=Candidatus Korobacter versatilis TaxID=658062 RepID=Q1ITI0_KORVE|nr:Rubrerythrin [Candidatus Koribacter versatilis Ellin345]
MMKRTFNALTEQEALHAAVFVEERNAEIYHRFAEMFVEFRDDDSLAIASVFWDMAAEERHHSTLLQNRYSELFGQRPCALTDDDIYEFVEIPRLEDADVFSGVTAQDHRTPKERALHVGLTAEVGAKKFYTGLIEACKDPRLKRLYTELADFEGEHVAFLERKIAEASRQGAGSS